VQVLLPAGVLSASTATVTVVSNPVITTAAPAGFELAGSAVQVLLPAGVSLAGLADITLSYSPAAAGSRQFEVESLAEATGVWSMMGAPVIDPVHLTATVVTPHFTIFALGLGGAAADLSTVRVYPNPFKPNGPNPAEGLPYSSGNPNSGIVFDNLPLMATVRIYTVSGQLAAQIVESDGSGRVQWDGRNGNGRDLASGGYLVVISSPGSKTVVKKLSILR
jgi:hypothetical protein